MSIKKVAILFVILVLTATTIWAVINNGFINRLVNPQDKEVNRETTSVFAPKKDKLSPEVEASFKSEMDKRVFRYGWGVDEILNATPWDYTKTPFGAEVVEYNKENNTLLLAISGPDTMPYYGSQKLVSMPTDCTASNTYVFNSNDGRTYINKTFSEEIATGTSILSFCIDEQCNTIGKLCKVFVDKDFTKDSGTTETTSPSSY